MKLKILKRIASILFATCISTSVAATSVGAIKTNSQDVGFTKKINKCNNSLNLIKYQIGIYRDKLAYETQHGSFIEAKDDDEAIANEKTANEKIVKVSELLGKIEDLSKKLDNLNMDPEDEDIFDLDTFENILKDFKFYMQNYGIISDSIETITKKIENIYIEDWNECIDQVNERHNNII